MRDFRNRFLRGVTASRFDVLYLCIALFLVASSVTRLALVVLHRSQLGGDLSGLLPAFAGGVLSDLVMALYLGVPLVLFLLIVPGRWLARRPLRWFVYAGFIVQLYALVYLGVVELYFFDEFNSRFNYVAVDYLVATKEVFVNIWDAYPVGRVLAADAVITLVLFVKLRRLVEASLATPTPLRRRLRFAAGYALPVAVAAALFNINSLQWSSNRVLNEIGSNGIYSFFYAAFTNELDYDAFYARMDDKSALRRVKTLIDTRDSRYLGPDDAYSIAREIRPSGRAKPMNVVIILEESFGSKFVGSLHPDGPKVAPEFDRLAADGLFFTHIYATGNRTVRGIEATLTSFPPIPGQSIVKRPGGVQVFSLPSVLHDKGYQTAFIYGGRSYFDNMGNFARANGFERVIDQTDFKRETFSTVWGVCDEDLFDNALPELDAMHAAGRPFFTLLLTVSNHSPFLYPAGRIAENPAERRREFGVRYADWALGRFMREARRHAFFDNTVFVILGDHGARVYGHQEIPMDSYEIPVLFYAPKLIAQGRRDGILGSQMDVAPTLLGLLGLDYRSEFFGRDLLQVPPDRTWALMSHNRDVALLRDDRMAVLGVRGERQLWQRNPATGEFRRLPATADPALLEDAIAYYQSAYRLYKTHGLTPLKQTPLFPPLVQESPRKLGAILPGETALGGSRTETALE